MTTYNLQIAQGTSYQLGLSLTDNNNFPINLSGYNVHSYLKSSYGATGYLTSLNPQIVSAISGMITLNLGESQTTGLPIGISFYDIKLVTGDISILALAGKAFISPTVS